MKIYAKRSIIGAQFLLAMRARSSRRARSISFRYSESTITLAMARSSENGDGNQWAWKMSPAMRWIRDKADSSGGAKYLHMNPVFHWRFFKHECELLFPSRVSIFLYLLFTLLPFKYDANIRVSVMFPFNILSFMNNDDQYTSTGWGALGSLLYLACIFKILWNILLFEGLICQLQLNLPTHFVILDIVRVH
ncbi:WRKY DNA-binding protein 26, partial [Striga asiatica]